MEFVYVAPREALFPACYPQGFHAFAGEEDARAFLGRLREHGFFVERARAERTPAWKQVIPYCVVAHDGRVLLTKRRTKGGEARLHGKLSIGIGGHINPIDLGDVGAGVDPERDLVLVAAEREIAEELDVRGTYELQLAGYLNDDSDSVGAVHLGLVFTALADGPVHIREQDMLEGLLVGMDELRARSARGEDLETWSRTLIAHLDELPLVCQDATHHSHP
jgi:predicted NUDIX family phosphoesterase